VSDQLPVENSGLMARIAAATNRADRGDQNALAAIGQVFDLVPSVWDAYGDLAAAAENALVELWAPNSALTRVGLRKKLAAMRTDLAGPEASPLERLLAERAVACWLQSYHADFTYARALKELPPEEAEPYQRRQDRASRQYLKALRSLADVRRLLVPALQVNIADRQVNIAGATGATATAPRRVRRSPGNPRRVGTADDRQGGPSDLA
jgi:hypothetical protein